MAKKTSRKKEEKIKPYFIFEKKNFVVMGIGLLVIAIGFLLMSGGGE